jgi:hypothetical protein
VFRLPKRRASCGRQHPTESSVAHAEPIRPIFRVGAWQVDHGSSIAGFGGIRAPEREHGALTIEQAVRTGDLVRLLIREHGVPAGALGTVTGFYRRSTGEVVCVTFETDAVVVPLESLEAVSPPGPDAP